MILDGGTVRAGVSVRLSRCAASPSSPATGAGGWGGRRPGLAVGGVWRRGWVSAWVWPSGLSPWTLGAFAGVWSFAGGGAVAVGLVRFPAVRPRPPLVRGVWGPGAVVGMGRRQERGREDGRGQRRGGESLEKKTQANRPERKTDDEKVEIGRRT